MLEVDASKPHIQYNHSNRNKLTVYEIQNCDCITSPEADSLLDCLRDCGFLFPPFPSAFSKMCIHISQAAALGGGGGLWGGCPWRHRADSAHSHSWNEAHILCGWQRARERGAHMPEEPNGMETRCPVFCQQTDGRVKWILA